MVQDQSLGTLQAHPVAFSTALYFELSATRLHKLSRRDPGPHLPQLCHPKLWYTNELLVWQLTFSIPNWCNQSPDCGLMHPSHNKENSQEEKIKRLNHTLKISSIYFFNFFPSHAWSSQECTAKAFLFCIKDFFGICICHNRNKMTAPTWPAVC